MARVEMRHAVGLGLAICLLLSVALSRTTASDPDDCAASVDLPTVVKRVSARNRSKTRVGDLTVSSDRLDFEGGNEKKSFSIAFASIRVLSYGRMGQDVDTDWVVLEVQEGDETRLVGLRDGRKFGFGKETDDLYVLLKAVVREARAAQYDVKRGMRTYDGLDDLLTLAVPAAWTPFDRSRTQVEGFPDLGRLLLTAERIAAGRDLSDETESDLRRFDAGRIRGVFVDRRKPASGMKCGGFSAKAQAAALDWFRADLSNHGDLKILGGPTAEEATLGGCRGLRIVARAQDSSGGELSVEHRVVAKSEAAVTLGFTIPIEERETAQQTVEEIVESLRFSVARSGRGK